MDRGDERRGGDSEGSVEGGEEGDVATLVDAISTVSRSLLSGGVSVRTLGEHRQRR